MLILLRTKESNMNAIYFGFKIAFGFFLFSLVFALMPFLIAFISHILNNNTLGKQWEKHDSERPTDTNETKTPPRETWLDETDSRK